jgi:hypothetical protein
MDGQPIISTTNSFKIALEFFSRILSRYFAEFILTIASLKLITTFLNSKLFLIVLYVFFKFKLPFFVNLHSRVLNHILFNTLHSVSAKGFLKYVPNQKKKEQLSVCIDILTDGVIRGNTVSENVISKMLFNKKAKFINELIQYLISIQKMLTESIRDKVSEKKLNQQFAKTFLVFSDMTFEISVYRVKDLGKNAAMNNYHIYINFLYILNDLLVIFTNNIPLVVNHFNLRDKKNKRAVDRNG